MTLYTYVPGRACSMRVFTAPMLWKDGRHGR